MPILTYLSDNQKVAVNAGQTILQASLKAKINHVHVCGGRARCSTCRVLIKKGLENCAPRTNAEAELAQELEFGPNIRLACQTKIKGDLSLRRLVLDEEDIALTSQLSFTQQANDSVGTERDIAILFADIGGFTSFAEDQLPYDVIHILNRYYLEMGEVIEANGGYIDNYMGDGLMALFGVDDNTNAALLATRAGLQMLKAMEHLKPYARTVYQAELDIRIGVHYGTAVVGTIGAPSYRKTTAIGDAVNLASRIEQANKTTGTRLLVSESTYEQIQTMVQTGHTATLPLQGKTGDHKLYEITGLDTRLLPLLENMADIAPPKIYLTTPQEPPRHLLDSSKDIKMWATIGGLTWTLFGAGLGLVLVALLGDFTQPPTVLIGQVLGGIVAGMVLGGIAGILLGGSIGLVLESIWFIAAQQWNRWQQRAKTPIQESLEAASFPENPEE